MRTCTDVARCAILRPLSNCASLATVKLSPERAIFQPSKFNACQQNGPSHCGIGPCRCSCLCLGWRGCKKRTGDIGRLRSRTQFRIKTVKNKYVIPRCRKDAGTLPLGLQYRSRWCLAVNALSHHQRIDEYSASTCADDKHTSSQYHRAVLLISTWSD
mgnify:CR=1 FL=1